MKGGGVQGIANEEGNTRAVRVCVCARGGVRVCGCVGVWVRVAVRLKRFTFTATFTHHSNYACVFFLFVAAVGERGRGECCRRC